MTAPIRVIVADDHNLFRAGVIELLQTLPDIDVIGEAGTGPDTVAVAGRTKPDVVLLDVEMPGLGAPATISQVRRASPASRIVILTSHDDAALALELINAGASAYLHKSANRAELEAAILALPRNDSNVLMSSSREAMRGVLRADPVAPVPLLSVREKEILQLIADGATNAAIARNLQLSESTVKRHIANFYAKLGANSRVNAVRKAHQLNLLSLSTADARS